jgi:hypothetical protein
MTNVSGALRGALAITPGQSAYELAERLHRAGLDITQGEIDVALSRDHSFAHDGAPRPAWRYVGLHAAGVPRPTAEPVPAETPQPTLTVVASAELDGRHRVGSHRTAFVPSIDTIRRFDYSAQHRSPDVLKVRVGSHVGAATG